MVVEEGATIKTAAVEPVDQEYVVAPLATNAFDWAWQTVCEGTATIGGEVTLIVFVYKALDPFPLDEIRETVYVPGELYVTVGFFTEDNAEEAPVKVQLQAVGTPED